GHQRVLIHRRRLVAEASARRAARWCALVELPRDSRILALVQPPAIAIRGAIKNYGPIVAVEGLDLEVPAGVCFGLLGPNGAGKSTTMRMLTAQALADAGEISVLGYELPEQSKQARLEMGVVPQLDNLDTELTCRQVLTVFARLYRVPRAERREAVDAALALANLIPRADTIVKEL